MRRAKSNAAGFVTDDLLSDVKTLSRCTGIVAGTWEAAMSSGYSGIRGIVLVAMAALLAGAASRAQAAPRHGSRPSPWHL